MKKLILFLFLGFMLSNLTSNAQITVTTWDTTSTSSGISTRLVFADAIPATSNTYYLVTFGGGAIQNGVGGTLPITTVVKDLYLNPTNTRVYGWGCFNNQYITKQNLNITRAGDGVISVFDGLMPVPSNYLQLGCKPMSSSIGLTETTNGLVLGWDWFTISGRYTLQYSVNGGTVTTVYPRCPTYVIPLANNGSDVSITVTTTCSDTTTSKSTTYKITGSPSGVNNPAPVTNATAVSTSVTTVTYTPANSTYSSFEITPIKVVGNSETRLTGIATTTSLNSYTFNNTLLKQTATGNNPKIRFGIVTINGTQRSSEVKTNTVTVR